MPPARWSCSGRSSPIASLMLATKDGASDRRCGRPRADRCKGPPRIGRRQQHRARSAWQPARASDSRARPRSADARSAWKVTQRFRLAPARWGVKRSGAPWFNAGFGILKLSTRLRVGIGSSGWRHWETCSRRWLSTASSTLLCILRHEHKPKPPPRVARYNSVRGVRIGPTSLRRHDLRRRVRTQSCARLLTLPPSRRTGRRRRVPPETAHWTWRQTSKSSARR